MAAYTYYGATQNLPQYQTQPQHQVPTSCGYYYVQNHTAPNIEAAVQDGICNRLLNLERQEDLLNLTINKHTYHTGKATLLNICNKKFTVKHTEPDGIPALSIDYKPSIGALIRRLFSCFMGQESRRKAQVEQNEAKVIVEAIANCLLNDQIAKIILNTYNNFRKYDSTKAGLPLYGLAVCTSVQNFFQNYDFEESPMPLRPYA